MSNNDRTATPQRVPPSNHPDGVQGDQKPDGTGSTAAGGKKDDKKNGVPPSNHSDG